MMTIKIVAIQLAFLVCAVYLMFFALGCQSAPNYISYSDLEKKLSAPLSARWYYMGTEGNYHHLAQRLPVESLFPIPESKYVNYFKISKESLLIPAEYELRSNKEEWVRIFWREVPLVSGMDFPWEVSIKFVPGADSTAP